MRWGSWVTWASAIPNSGGSGLDYYSAIVLAEEMSRAGNGGVGMAIAVHAEMATPPVLKFGTEEQKQRFLVPAIRGEQGAGGLVRGGRPDQR